MSDEILTFKEKGRQGLRDTTWILQGDTLIVRKVGSPDRTVPLARIRHAQLEFHKVKGGPYHQLVLTSAEGERWFISSGQLPWWRPRAQLHGWQPMVRRLLAQLATHPGVQFQAGSPFSFYPRLVACLLLLAAALYQFAGKNPKGLGFVIMALFVAIDLPHLWPRKLDPLHPPEDIMGPPASGWM